MNYPCNMIRDLLPLYYDGVCSEESQTAVEEHLSECLSCRQLYAKMGEAGPTAQAAYHPDREQQKAVSFQSVRKKLLRRQFLTAAAVLFLLTAAFFSAAAVLKHSSQVISCEGNISVSMTDGSLIGRLQGNRADRFRVKRVELQENGQEKICLFFCLSGTKWDALTTDREVFSEYVLCPADKGADQIDRVFYYTGDDTGLEQMDEKELQEVIRTSVLLWSK